MNIRIILLLILIFIPFALAQSPHTPFWSQISTSIVSGLQYSPGKNYGFEINWTDSDLGFSGISKVLFETDFSGILKNYTDTDTPAVNNNTQGIYWISFTDLKAGTYVFKWYANDTNNDFNSTDQQTYIIAKNSSGYLNLTLNRTENNRSYNQYTNANFTVYLNLTGKTVYLNSNYTGWSLQSNSTSVIYNITNLSSLGFFNLTAYWDGDENYTSSSKTYFFDNMAPQYSNPTAPPSPTVYSAGANYQFSISWIDATISKVLFESNYNVSYVNYSTNTTPPVQNSSGNFWIVLTDVASKNFSYRWIANDSLNKINYTNFSNYSVTKAIALTTTILPSTSVTNGTETTVICSSNTNQVTTDNFKLYRNSTLISNISSVTRMDVSTLDVGTYNYTCNNTETANYTNYSITMTLTVSAPSTPPSGEFKITDVSSPQIRVGNSGSATFNLTNTLGQSLTNIRITLDGVPSSWYTIENPPTSLSTGSSVIININFNIPTDAEARVYSITITATGNTANETKTITQTMTLTVNAPPPPPTNNPPSYSDNTTNNSIAGKLTLFSLKWIDDSGLSSYIFSSNNSGKWENDSWVPLSGTEDWSNVTKILNKTVGLTIGWKVYANDSSDAWSVSEEFYLKTTGFAIDIITPLIWISFSIIIGVIAIVVYNLLKKMKAKPKEEEEVIYVYTREDYSREEVEKESKKSEYVYTREEAE